ncbi:MAG: TetR/AcrR family transcriptional regulator [Candidatus Lambdaproteobacteria bacterium]|nr:TetR/AcrR family transcriptional regulator [Candidatus Lambdaproteobacteria bacterium]
MGTAETKAEIIRTATMLFNEHGTRAVSTNHIAEKMGVSPGRIYYHFRNKEDIIREIYRQIIYFFNPVRKLPRDRTVNINDLRRLCGVLFTYMWEYRFFLREAVPLMQRDPQLRKRLHDVRRRRLVQIRYFLQGLIKSGVMQEPEEEGTLDELATISWLITNAWPNFLMVDEKSLCRENVQKGVELVLRVLKPYLTEQAWVELSTPYDYPDPVRKVS